MLSDILSFYKYEIVASQFREKNKILFSNRISAFNLWRQIDKSKNGFLPFSQFNELLNACAFEEYTSQEEMMNDAETALEFLPNERKYNHLRFRLFESLFLERCAL